MVSLYRIFKSPLFNAPNTKLIVHKNAKCEINFDSAPFHLVAHNKNCIDFFKKILEKDPEKRITPTEALCHPFLTESVLTEEDEI